MTELFGLADKLIITKKENKLDYQLGRDAHLKRQRKGIRTSPQGGQLGMLLPVITVVQAFEPSGQGLGRTKE